MYLSTLVLVYYNVFQDGLQILFLLNITRNISFISATAESKMVKVGVALVTGSSTGIGFETSLALSRNGIYTFATMREARKGDTINKIAKGESLPLNVLGMDVDDDGSVRETVLKIIDEAKRIDILVNNAGYRLLGALEDI